MDVNSDLLVVAIIAILVLVAILTVVLVYFRSRKLIATLNDADGFLASMHREDDGSGGLVAAVREHMVSVDRGKIVLSKPLPALRREYAEDEVAHYIWFSVGGILTGLALVATFVLIAIVMQDDVSGAIRESASADEAASTNHLAGAVGLLGGKFFISATGVALSVFALLYCNTRRGRVFRVAEHPGHKLMSAFTSVEARQLEFLRDEAEARQREHAQVRDQLVMLNTRIEKLNSIEVSVKALGNEVSANLKHIMKDAMGEQLKEMLADTMVEVERIATNVQQNLSDNFGARLSTMTSQLQHSLEALQKTIEGQAQGQLDKILEKLQNTVSGGFQSESQKMVVALEKFASVVPALEQQLRTMTGEVAQESRQRAQESAKMGEVLMQRVTTLLDTMSAQQTANAQAIERMQAASEQGAEAIARRLEESGTGLVNNVLGASRAEIEAIVGQLRAATEASAQRHGHIDAQAQNTAAAIAQATEGLVRGANSVIEVAKQASQLVTHTQAGGEAIRGASQQFLQAGNTLLGSVKEMQQVIASAHAQTLDQHKLLLRQQEYTKEVEKLWPQLFDTYLRQFKAGADELGRSWETFHQKVAQLSGTIGGDFAENTELLSESVRKLVEHLTPSKRAPA